MRRAPERAPTGAAREAGSAQGEGGEPARVDELEGTLRPDQPSWAITKMASTGTIVLRFVGPTRSWEIAEFFSALTEMMPAENANVVFDLRELHGHNPDVKTPAKKWLVENKTRIRQVTVVVPRRATMLKIATAVISLASGVKIKIRDDLDGEMLVAEP